MFTDNVKAIVSRGSPLLTMVKRIKNDRCFHKEDYISLWKFEECKRANKAI